MFQVNPILWVAAGIALAAIGFIFLDRYTDSTRRNWGQSTPSRSKWPNKSAPAWKRFFTPWKKPANASKGGRS